MRVKTGGEGWRRAADNGAAESRLPLPVLCAVAALRTGGRTYTKFPFYARRTAAAGCEYPFGEARFCMLGFAGFLSCCLFCSLVPACFGFSEHCFGKPEFRPWEGRGRVPVPVLSSFGGFSFLLVRKLSGKYVFRRVVAQERKPPKDVVPRETDGRSVPFRFLGGRLHGGRIGFRDNGCFCRRVRREKIRCYGEKPFRNRACPQWRAER